MVTGHRGQIGDGRLRRRDKEGMSIDKFPMQPGQAPRVIGLPEEMLRGLAPHRGWVVARHPSITSMTAKTPFSLSTSAPGTFTAKFSMYSEHHVASTIS